MLIAELRGTAEQHWHAPEYGGAHLGKLRAARLVELGMLVTGQVGVDQLSGPVGVAEVMASTAKYSISAFLQLVAFISINLGVMNLLPLPPWTEGGWYSC